jgi:hypothetical protein
MKTMKTLSVAFLLATAGTTFASTQQAQEIKPMDEIQGQNLGQLDCTIAGGWGMLLGSSKAVACSFTHTDGTVEKYAGSLDKLGIDIGVTEEAYMTWIVLTTASNVPGEYALAGEYVGVSGQVNLGIGLGANALIGGSDKNIGLQPLSVQASTGLNVAVGLASLKLEAAPADAATAVQ